jgi:hypothetical protein
VCVYVCVCVCVCEVKCVYSVGKGGWLKRVREIGRGSEEKEEEEGE